MWPRSNLYLHRFYTCRLSRLPDDGLTAYFAVHPSLHSWTSISLANEQSADSRELKDLLPAHLLESTTFAYVKKLYVVARIGGDTNNTYFSDLPIPSIVLHAETSEISLDWKALFTTVFYEGQHVLKVKTRTHRDPPHVQYWDVDYPIVFTDEDLHCTVVVDYSLCKEVLHHRCARHGWRHDRNCSSDHLHMIHSLDRLEDFVRGVRIEEIFARIDLQYAEYRGGPCTVVDD
ncbi:hypothetical protein HBI24_174290 [Parastagonospora nodorum]|nr:hypothetical protein HBH49_166700 [Parastagonospora nodorum]KAH4219904.1 hypothetical protein HBI06_179820 [Parastagonospora nodorum]KAH4227471.1 hypothetical protein HBI05_213250 [Parastagonospora nodorum]KAH5054413.1 hypothetical protein HBH96_141050 [Parastagonospora nodorum]KAH5063684.1 hypothetical protein HBH95_221150 [Parastagonospora nodorum]